MKNQKIKDFAGEFEMVGDLSIDDQIRETHVRLRNITEYEFHINAIDEGYGAEDALFNGYIYKINTPHFNLSNRSQYGNGCDFKHEIFEYRGNNCHIPTKVCYIKCVNFSTGKGYK